MTQRQYDILKCLLGFPFVAPGRLARAFRKAGVDILLRDIQVVYLSPNYKAYLDFDPYSQFDPDQREILSRIGL